MVHHYQETDVSCGVAALQMALEAAGHPAPAHALLADELQTDLHGTRPEAFERALSEMQVPYLAWHGDVTTGDLRHLINDHALVVCYQSKELRVGHFALVLDIRDDAVELDDPWFGPCKCLAIDEFESLWESHPHQSRPLRHWVLAVRRATASPLLA